MFHSSFVPIAFPISLVIGLLSYGVIHGLGFSAADSASAAQTVTVLANVVIGIPKNLIVGDILSLIFVRPLSAFAAVSLIGHMAGVG